jgi:hypothetical protein
MSTRSADLWNGSFDLSALRAISCAEFPPPGRGQAPPLLWVLPCRINGDQRHVGVKKKLHLDEPAANKPPTQSRGGACPLPGGRLGCCLFGSLEMIHDL